MPDTNLVIPLLNHLNSLVGGLFLLTAFGLIAVRQVLACLKMFVAQSILLAASAFILGYQYTSMHLFIVAGIAIGTKSILIPWFFRWKLSQELHARREVSQVLNIPMSLLAALALAIFAYFITRPLANVTENAAVINLPIGAAGLLMGAYIIAVRREALPQVFGILAMENGAFFAGISIASDLPLITELAAAFDVLVFTIVMGLLTRRIYEHVGRTTVGDMMVLKEE